ncbi:MAG: helix-turn-helix domain-containing protein [Salinivirgaceae bacterium]|jgi:hypothetical protein|nr:helix-turn-helix domain-containing protein [Salinivirgaceae bacterium]
MEEIKQVKLKGVKDLVEVSEDGSVIKYLNKVVNQHLIRTSKNSKGYKAVSIQGKSFYVHRIVAEAFVFNKRPIASKYVLHMNNDISNNHYSNLSWGTSKELYAKNSKLREADGEKYRGSSSISYDEAVKIAKRLDNGEFAKDICSEYGVSEMSIARIRKRYCKEKSASPRYNREIKTTVFKLAKKYTAPEIAKMTGLTYHTVYRWLKKNQQTTEKPVFYY